jgi:hypothetical protein
MNRNSRRWLAGLVVIAIFVALQPSLFAQGFTAVTGSVSDPTGAVIPGVEVTVTNASTGASRTVITNETGSYTVSQLPPGTYSISASLPGFRTQVMSNVPLPVGETVVINLPLEVGEVTDVVDVIATIEAINTVDAKVGGNFDTQKIIDLPLNARNIVGLLGLQVGVQMSDVVVLNDGTERDDGGQVNGARNDQQNIVLDGVNINRQEAGSSLEGALPTTLDSIQEFVVQTAGAGGQASRGSGGQVQLVTKSGSNEWHGSAYEVYRSTGTSARNFFASEPDRLIRHIPGGSVGGPILKDKLFFFGSYERQTDRSSILASRNVPTPQFLDGIIRYERTDGSFGVITDGPGSDLERWTNVLGDTWNPNVLSYIQLYRPFSNDAARTTPGSDNGANTLRYRFQSPFVRNRNIYISRMDFTANDNHTLFVRGTLNDDVRTLGSERFPGFDDSRERLNNSKGFAASWNWVISPVVNSNFTVGLTREAFESTGNNRSFYNMPLFSEPFQTQGGVQRAIDTWNVVENFSWLTGNHNLQLGGNVRYITNNYLSFDLIDPPQYGGGANLTGNDIGVEASPGLARAVGAAEFDRIQDAEAVGNAVMAATGSLSRFSEDVQFDLDGNKLAAGSPFKRKFRIQEYDFYLQDTWRMTPNFTLNYGVAYSMQTPPYEANGVQLNWTQNLGNRWRTQFDTTKTILELPLFTAQPAGRANGLPDYYTADTNNWAPRVSFAWSPDADWATKGGPLVIRGGYTMTYDAIGRRFARDAAESGSVGLKSDFSVPGFSYSIDGENGIPYAPRVGPGLSTPREFFPSIGDRPSFVLPVNPRGIGGLSQAGIDSGLYSPTNNLINLTVSKELPGGWLLEASFVGRYARNLLATVDIASPVNVRDPISGQTYYQAITKLYETYENKGATIADVTTKIPWFENVYSGVLNYVNKASRFDSIRPEGGFPSATQAFYAVFHRRGNAAGPLSSVSLVDRLVEIESAADGPGNILMSPQAQFFGMFTNISRSNYNSGQFTVRKRFSQGFSLTGNYTLSKSMDITSAAESRGERANGQSGEGLANDPYNPERNYNISDFDRRHQFNGNFVVQLPFGHGRAFANNISSVANQIIGGWEFSGIAVASSARPFNFTTGRFNHHYFGRSQALLTGSLPFGVRKEDGNRVFLIDADSDTRRALGRSEFVNVYPGSILGRNQGRGPKFVNMDVSVTKNFSITENIRARFRAEAFNIMNHPNFGIPESGTRIDRSSFGEITETRGTERVMQFSFRLEF